MSIGLGLRTWGLRLASTTHPPKTRKSSFSSLLFPPQRALTTTCSVSNPFRSEKKQKVIVISGPTGSGKTRLALELAKRLNGEIISADSVQVYRGLDVGSAKPSPSDRKEVPHHLVDILDPFEDYSVGQFFEDARQATRDIFERGRVPVVAGGTGLYLRWYMYGRPEVPKASPEVASEAFSELMILQNNEDWDAAVQLVKQAGDPKAHLVARNNWYKLRRSLEIIKSTGSPPTAFRVPYDSFKEHLDKQISDTPYEGIVSADGPGENLSKDLDYDFICFFLSSQRVDLYRQIDLRCEEMLAGGKGILSEATWLLDLGLLPNMNSATRAIGYRQRYRILCGKPNCVYQWFADHGWDGLHWLNTVLIAMEYLVMCREQGGSSAGDFYAFLSEFQKASRNFAKRQMTWFRNELIYQWLDASKPLDMVLNFILDAYNDESGKILVPDSLRMDKDVTGRREASELKIYRTKNRHFITREDCYHVLDWIRRTQDQLKSACS